MILSLLCIILLSNIRVREGLISGLIVHRDHCPILDQESHDQTHYGRVLRVAVRMKYRHSHNRKEVRSIRSNCRVSAAQDMAHERIANDPGMRPYSLSLLVVTLGLVDHFRLFCWRLVHSRVIVRPKVALAGFAAGGTLPSWYYHRQPGAIWVYHEGFMRSR